MRELHQLVPSVEEFLILEPEELAQPLLKALLQRSSSQSHFNKNNLAGELCSREPGGYPLTHQDGVQLAFIEAWVFLQSTGLIVPAPGTNGQNGWERLSRRGLRMAQDPDANEFRAQLQFPRHLIHPRIVDAVWPLFLRGQYSAAVFQSMREVEIFTREAGGFPAEEHGLRLMRTAFHKDNGPLRDQSLPDQEREALANLVSGAIGVYKNPHSHRHVEMNDPVEAIEMIMLASHILRIIDARKGG
jgi:uncharacterized protein (TIGR02391 family)